MGLKDAEVPLARCTLASSTPNEKKVHDDDGKGIDPLKSCSSPPLRNSALKFDVNGAVIVGWNLNDSDNKARGAIAEIQAYIQSGVKEELFEHVNGHEEIRMEGETPTVAGESER